MFEQGVDIIGAQTMRGLCGKSSMGSFKQLQQLAKDNYSESAMYEFKF